MFERKELSHENLWWAILKAPLVLFFFVGPFFAGVMISPVFAAGELISVQQWIIMGAMMLTIALLIYINGLLGAFFFGVPMFFFLNSIKMQNRWLYLLVGFASGSFFNLLFPWYSRFLYEGVPYPDIIGVELTKLAIASYPILFGLMGMAVSWNFWRQLEKAEKAPPGKPEPKANKA